MKFLFLAVLLVSPLISSLANASLTNHCSRYESNDLYMKAIATQAERMKYDLDELCNLPHLLDIYIVETDIINDRQKPIPHVWLTLHYAEHSCQYFLRSEDMVTTKKNCYNTF